MKDIIMVPKDALVKGYIAVLEKLVSDFEKSSNKKFHNPAFDEVHAAVTKIMGSKQEYFEIEIKGEVAWCAKESE